MLLGGLRAPTDCLLYKEKLRFSYPAVPKGRPLVVLHGWGTDSHFTQPIASLFPERPVILLDMPGYGINANYPHCCEDFEELAHTLCISLPEGCDLMSWSLSSLVAIRCCKLHPEHFKSLVTVCGTPFFPEAEDWPGFSKAMIEKIEKNFTRTRAAHLLNLFFSMQCLSASNTLSVKTFIKESSVPQKKTKYETLKAELQQMAGIDERHDLQALKIPCLHLFGELDRLIPAALAEKISFNLNHQTFVFKNSAHMPYLTEPKLFAQVVRNFL